MERLQHELRSAREHIQQQQNFLAIVAHELRNPMSPVLISLDALILDVADKPLDRDTLVRRLQTTRRYVESMRMHIDRLLEFSRLRAGHLQLEYEDVDLSALVGTVLDQMAPMIQAAECELRTSFAMPLHGRWDRMRLTEVIWNLVSNAVKYGAGAPIEVSTSATAETATLTVEDHGLGIAEDDRELVFRQYERVHTGSHTGFGVGLWLVRRIIEAMNGSVQLTSELGKGSRFSVTLRRGR